MVAQLEHQFRIGRLSVQGLWFYCQPMMGSLHALGIVIEKVSSNNLFGSATLNLLQSQAKAMAGDNAVPSLQANFVYNICHNFWGINKSLK
ncbi:Gamma-tubulin complex component protein [Dioscorea alata]|uniref:Gamma-tubulin complex component protein n=1 Tax=Dioscorea alata TaxID=55571 RepID=A0ACB7UXW6_DIOAL|nr:Gamma-tubulin complex component protein [Dioscorea alata]